jgi:O-antigen ligase
MMNLPRTGLLLGLACAVPVTVWLVGTLAEPDGASRASVLLALQSLVLVQALAAAGFAPIAALQEPVGDAMLGVVLLIAAPLPLSAVGWLAEAATGTDLVLMQGYLLFGALLLFAAARPVRRLAPLARRMMVAALQVGAAAGVWVARDFWRL